MNKSIDTDILKHDITKKVMYSVVIPVFNSSKIVAQTVRRTLDFFYSNNYSFEIILVNDGSRDGSWEIIKDLAIIEKRITAINLLKNYGQHAANLCGFRYSKGDYIVTMDDDLQNPPEEIIHLIKKAQEGHDLVIGEFKIKMHAYYRILGSKLVNWINVRVFDKPEKLILSNFRLLRRDVVDRICSYNTAFPYIPGLALMFSYSPVNVKVEHRARSVGGSNYNLWKILKLVSTILFNYSSFPLRFTAGIGLTVSIFSFILGTYYLLLYIVNKTTVPGWTTIVVLLAFFNGIIMSMVGILGEYIVRLLNQSSGCAPYYVKDKLNNE